MQCEGWTSECRQWTIKKYVTFVAKILENPVRAKWHTLLSLWRHIANRFSFCRSVRSTFRSVGRLRRFKSILSPFSVNQNFWAEHKKWDMSYRLLYDTLDAHYAVFGFSNFALALIPAPPPTYMHTHTHTRTSKIHNNKSSTRISFVRSFGSAFTM